MDSSKYLVELNTSEVNTVGQAAGPKETYIHWTVVLVIVLLVVSICCWGLGPSSWRRYLGYEGFCGDTGLGGQGADMLNVPQYVQSARCLHAMSPGAASRLYTDESQVNFEPSASGQASMPGIQPMSDEMTSPFREININGANFLGGPQAPAFYSPPGSTNLTTHQYPQAINSAQQALRLGLGRTGAEAAVRAESFYGGGYEGLSNPVSVAPLTSGRGFSNYQLTNLIP